MTRRAQIYNIYMLLNVFSHCKKGFDLLNFTGFCGHNCSGYQVCTNKLGPKGSRPLHNHGGCLFVCRLCVRKLTSSFPDFTSATEGAVIAHLPYQCERDNSGKLSQHSLCTSVGSDQANAFGSVLHKFDKVPDLK